MVICAKYREVNVILSSKKQEKLELFVKDAKRNKQEEDKQSSE